MPRKGWRRVLDRAEMKSEPARYRVVAAACVVLRHPARTVRYVTGGSRTACPCGHISYGLATIPAADGSGAAS